MDEYKYSSLCKVYKDYEGHMRLNRMADVSENVILDGFAKEVPGYFNLFANDGPLVEDYIGVWDWSLTPNIKDPSKDYILTAFDYECIPIEVVMFTDCMNIEEVVRRLEKGLERPILSGKILFACQEPNSKKCIGVLCSSKEMIEKGTTFCLKDDIIYLQQYNFLTVDVYKFNNRMVYKSFDLSPTDKIVYVKDVLEVVKNIIVTRASWTTMKQKGLTRNEYKTVKDFISEIPMSNIIEEISSTLGCKLEQAQEFLDIFTEHANEYIDGESIGVDVLSHVIQNSPDLTAKCNSLLLENWEKENSKKIADAESDLSDVKDEIASEEKKLDRLNQKYIEQKEKINSLKQEMRKQEKLASDVEDQVKARIESAKQDAASFIATQVFVAPGISSNDVGSTEIFPILNKGIPIDSENLEKYDNWSVLVELIQFEIEDEGVSKKYSEYVAAFLYAAYVNRCHVLLLGPNGRAIADAFSACVTGKTCDYLYCEGLYDPIIFDEIEKSEHSITLIDNLFDPEWNRHINNYASYSSKFLIALNPYAEDLLIEPKGILNYWIPLLTELFVDRKPLYDFDGGEKAKNYRDIKTSKIIHGSGKCLKTLRLSSLSRSVFKKLISDMFLIVDGEYNLNAELLLAGVPCAYILGELSNLNEYCEDSIVDSDMKEILNRYLGDLE